MIKIPKEAFKTKAEDGSDVVPSVGDEVPLDGFTGKVESEDGDNLVVNLTDYNGSPVEYVDDPAEEAKEPADANDDQQKKDLLDEMAKPDGKAYD